METVRAFVGDSLYGEIWSRIDSNVNILVVSAHGMGKMHTAQTAVRDRGGLPRHIILSQAWWPAVYDQDRFLLLDEIDRCPWEMVSALRDILRDKKRVIIGFATELEKVDLTLQDLFDCTILVER